MQGIFSRLRRAEIPVQVAVIFKRGVGLRHAGQHISLRVRRRDGLLRAAVGGPGSLIQEGPGSELSLVQRIDGNHKLPVFQAGDSHQTAVFLRQLVKARPGEIRFLLRARQHEGKLHSVVEKRKLHPSVPSRLRQDGVLPDQPDGVRLRRLLHKTEGGFPAICQIRDLPLQAVVEGILPAGKLQIRDQSSLHPEGIPQDGRAAVLLRAHILFQRINRLLHAGIDAVSGHKAEIPQRHICTCRQHCQKEYHQQKLRQLFQGPLLSFFHHLRGGLQPLRNLPGAQALVVFHADDLLIQLGKLFQRFLQRQLFLPAFSRLRKGRFGKRLRCPFLLLPRLPARDGLPLRDHGQICLQRTVFLPIPVPVQVKIQIYVIDAFLNILRLLTRAGHRKTVDRDAAFLQRPLRFLPGSLSSGDILPVRDHKGRPPHARPGRPAVRKLRHPVDGLKQKGFLVRILKRKDLFSGRAVFQRRSVLREYRLHLLPEGDEHHPVPLRQPFREAGKRLLYAAKLLFRNRSGHVQQHIIADASIRPGKTLQRYKGKLLVPDKRPKLLRLRFPFPAKIKPGLRHIQDHLL